ncbi:MAG: hypothetical protein HQL00_14440 [Nitrospirae bacterium]|nr:hypothetical protein [Nitrospirota bacterium]
MKGVTAALILLVFICGYSSAEVAAAPVSKLETPPGVREIPFTQDDRDRLIRLEARMEGLDRRMDGLEKRMDRIESRMDILKSDMDKKFEQMMTFMLWGFGILFGGIGILMTTVIWDRRTALAPAIRKNKELEERGDNIERTLKELDVKYLEIKDTLKRAGLL